MNEKREIKVGDDVRYIDEDSHRDCPEYYPPVGTVGRVLTNDGDTALIQWPPGSTDGNGRWYAGLPNLIPVQNDNDDK